MKKVFTILFLVFLCGAITSQTREALDRSVFFAVTGHTGQIDSVCMDTLINLYDNNKVHVLKSVKHKIDSLFGCTNDSTLETIEEFYQDSLFNGILITDLGHLSNRVKTLVIDSFHFFDHPVEYAFKVVELDTALYDSLFTKVTYTGVSAITRHIGVAADKLGTGKLTSGVTPVFNNSDYVHVSNEVSISDTCSYGKEYNLKFCTKERDFQAFLDINANIVELTGNHNQDFGKQSFINTYKWFMDNGFYIFGGGIDSVEAMQPLFLKMNDGSKVALLGYNFNCPYGECIDDKDDIGANKYRVANIKKALAMARDSASFVVVHVQMGEYDGYDPHKYQKMIATQLIEMGADMVFGSQAHFVKKIAYYKGKPVFYGAGNFLFDQVHKEGLRQGYILHNYFYNGRLVHYDLNYTYISDDRVPVLANKKQAEKIRKEIWDPQLVY